MNDTSNKIQEFKLLIHGLRKIEQDLFTYTSKLETSPLLGTRFFISNKYFYEILS